MPSVDSGGASLILLLAVMLLTFVVGVVMRLEVGYRPRVGAYQWD